jgi:hypothetical protein
LLYVNNENPFLIKTDKMKATRLISMVKKVSLGILTTMLIYSLSSCARKVTFLTSSFVPAAKGYVKIKRDRNKNYVIKVHVSDLAQVERLQPSKRTYVVWMVTDQDITKNIGRVNSSNNLKLSYETKTPFNPVKIFITAETDESPSYPDQTVVLTTDSFWQ